MTDATSAPADEPKSATETLAPPPEAAPLSPLPPPASAAPAAPADRGAWMDKLPLWTVPAILVAVPLLAALTAKAVPAFYENVVWQYYWGPIKADAENMARLTYHGVEAHSGYNVVNTLSWAALLGLCILGIAQMLRHFRTPMDSRLIVAATSWVVVGSMAHVLEDTGLFATPTQYFFITPPIYLLFGAFGIGAFLVGQWLKRVEAKSDVHGALRVLLLVHVVLALLWLGLWLKPWDQLTVYVNPLWVAGIALVSYFFARYFVLRKGTIDPTQLCLTLSLGTYLLVIAYIVSFLNDPWMEPSDNRMPWSSVIAPLLALAVTAVVAFAPRKGLLGFLAVGTFLAVFAVALKLLHSGFLARLTDSLPTAATVAIAAAVAAYVLWSAVKSLRPRLPQLLQDMGPAYRLPINLLIVFGQMTDAFATSFGIDLAGYDEKHVLSAGIIDQFREASLAVGFDFGAQYPTFIAFVLVKLLVSLLVIFAMDVASKDDPNTNPDLIGLVKFAIIMVGIGPGVRDFTRLSLGV